MNNLGIIGLNSKNGDIVFKLNNNGNFPFPPIIIYSVIYFFTIKPSTQHLNVIFNAFDIKRGRYIYKKIFPTNIKEPLFIISYNFLLFYHYYEKTLYCYDLKSGKMKWKKEIQNVINKKFFMIKIKFFFLLGMLILNFI